MEESGIKRGESTFQAQTKKTGNRFVIVAVVLILGLLGISVGYFSAFERSNLQPAPSVSPSIPVSLSPTSTANAPTKVVTAPLHATEFVKEVVVSNSANMPVGLVSYHDTKNNSWMKIHSLLDTSDTYSHVGLAQIEAYLKGTITLKAFQDINTWEFPFRNYGGGASNKFIKSLPGIVFPEVEHSKAMMVYTTQSVFGQITVVVLAKKGNDIIQLSKYMNDRSLYEPLEKLCNTNSQADAADEKCYESKLLQDVTLRNAAVREAKALVSQFAIK
jgi:hypothetical protein